MLRQTPIRGRWAGLLLAPLLALAFGTSTAAAASIYACVNKHSGSARIVGAKTKCKKTERRVSWNTTGPAGSKGAAGATGNTGAAGMNGVGPDYASRIFGPSPLTNSEAGSLVATKAIPAGSYLISAKAIIGGNAKSAVFVGVLCELLDSSGTPALVEPPAALDLGEWAQTLSLNDAEYSGAGMIEMQSQITTTQPTTVALGCAALSGGEEAMVEAFSSQVNALQVTANL
jgi:hypothetical protein